MTSERRDVKITIRYEANDYRMFNIPANDYDRHEQAFKALDRFDDDNQHRDRSGQYKPVSVIIDGETLTVAEVTAWSRLRAEAVAAFPETEFTQPAVIVAFRQAFIDGGLAALRLRR